MFNRLADWLLGLFPFSRKGMDDVAEKVKDEALPSVEKAYDRSGFVVTFVFLLILNVFRNADSWKNDLIGNAFWFIFENLLVAFAFVIAVKFIRRQIDKKWIENHQKIWLKGKWLHLHKKNNDTIRVGYVEISQSYNNIAAEGYNYGYKLDEGVRRTDSKDTTTWEYISARIVDHEPHGAYLQAFYTADKNNNINEENNGMHSLKIIPNPDRRSDPPFEMKGTFGDVNTFDVDSGYSASDSYLSGGELLLYRLDEAGEKALFHDGRLDLDAFDEMVKSRETEDSDLGSYFSSVRKAAAEICFKKKYREFSGNGDDTESAGLNIEATDKKDTALRDGLIRYLSYFAWSGVEYRKISRLLTRLGISFSEEEFKRWFSLWQKDAKQSDLYELKKSIQSMYDTEDTDKILELEERLFEVICEGDDAINPNQVRKTETGSQD